MRNVFNWERRWFLTDARASLDDGYLPDEQSSPLAPEEATGFKLSELHCTPCLILLGAPGMGKTTEIGQEIESARGRGEAVTLIPLSSLTGPSDLESSLATARVEDFASRKGVWNLFLDGLDEIIDNVSATQKAIPQQLRLLAEAGLLENVRFRISCRTAEWPAALESELRSLWSKDEVKALRLERLRKDDVAKAARQALGDQQTQNFLRLIEEYKGEPLASRPITLRMLLNVFRHQSEFPRQKRDLYYRGLLALIEESNIARRGNRQTWRLDVASKLVIAGRIAAATLLSDSSEVWAGTYAEASPRVLTLGTIAGGLETSFGSGFSVGEFELRDVLLTPLFIPIGEDRFVFAHKTFSEFLAAHYLYQHRLPTNQLFELFQTSEETAAIPPQLVEVAAWLAGMHPDFFRQLARTQPDILLRSDVAASSIENRELLVQQFMLAVGQGELHDFERDIRRRYAGLWHPGLADQLQPYISSKSAGVVARRVAIDIAEANKLTELAPLLLRIALDRSDDQHIRAQAVAAISELDVAQIAQELRPLALENNPDDINDDIKGWSLRALFPKYISIEELLSSLTPEKQENYIGPYHVFLSDFSLPPINDRSAVAVVQWATAKLTESDDEHSFQRFAARLLEQTWELANSDSVLNAFADFFVSIAGSQGTSHLDIIFKRCLESSSNPKIGVSI